MRKWELPFNQGVKEEIQQMNENAENTGLPAIDKNELIRRNAELAKNAKDFIQPWAEAFDLNTGEIVKKVIYQGVTKGSFDLGAILGMNEKKEKEMKLIKIVKALAIWAPIFLLLIGTVTAFLFFEVKILTILMGKI